MADGNGYDGTEHDRARLFLYPNKYWKSEKHPVKTGPGEISRLALRRIIDHAKETGDDPIKLRVASWERTSKKGNDYTYITVEPDEPRKGAAPDQPTQHKVDPPQKVTYEEEDVDLPF